MLSIRLTRRPGGAPLQPPVAKELTPSGLSIGRGETCDLVLEDPLRLVSRQHAVLEAVAADAARIRCVSSNASLSVNGEAVPPGGDRPVAPGDRIGIGAFELTIEHSGTAEPAAADEAIKAGHEVPPDAVPPEAPSGPAAEPPALGAAMAAAQPSPRAPSRLDRWFDLADPPANDARPPAPPVSAGPPVPSASTTPGSASGTVTPGSGSGTVPPGSASGAVPPGTAQAASAAPAESAPAPKPARKRRSAAAPAMPESGTPATPSLQAAFLAGAGLDAGTRLDPDPQWARHAGALLRSLSQGSYELLRGRAITKQSIRAEGTRIAARDNNPLKFAPDAAEYLRLLLDPQGRPGFLSPLAALDEVHDDLRRHQVAMMAGMRAAVFELIKRLGPEATEAAEGPATGAGRWLPGQREARLWQRHCQEHAALMASLDDAFEAAFGRAFLQAYEAQARRSVESAAPSPAGDRADSGADGAP